MSLPKPYLPQPVSDVDVAFPARALDIMPAWDDIPDDFKGYNRWDSFVRTFLFRGIGEPFSYLPMEVDGERLDGETILRHLQVIAGSFAPQHEHKEAAMAYLCELWIEAMIFNRPDADASQAQVVGEIPLEEWLEFLSAKGQA